MTKSKSAFELLLEEADNEVGPREGWEYSDRAKEIAKIANARQSKEPAWVTDLRHVIKELLDSLCEKDREVLHLEQKLTQIETMFASVFYHEGEEEAMIEGDINAKVTHLATIIGRYRSQVGKQSSELEAQNQQIAKLFTANIDLQAEKDSLEKDLRRDIKRLNRSYDMENKIEELEKEAVIREANYERNVDHLQRQIDKLKIEVAQSEFWKRKALKEKGSESEKLGKIKNDIKQEQSRRRKTTK